MMEGLTAMLNHEVVTGDLVPPSLKNGVTISHILFADDVLIFSIMDTSNANTIKRVLDRFPSSPG